MTSVKNVAEVVQKMNSGDWPIRIEEDEDGMREERERERANEEQKQIEVRRWILKIFFLNRLKLIFIRKKACSSLKY